MPIGQWSHVVWRYNQLSQTMTIFVNGVGIQDYNHPGFQGQDTLFIGLWPSYYYSGSIDELQIFNDAISDLQVAGLFNKYSGSISTFTSNNGPNAADCINGGTRVNINSASFNCSCTNGKKLQFM